MYGPLMKSNTINSPNTKNLQYHEIDTADGESILFHAAFSNFS